MPDLGTFTLRQVDPSWSATLLLGALDYYGVKAVVSLQVVPDTAHWTCDLPDLSRPRDPVVEPAWRWLTEPWGLPVPESSTAATNLSALRGCAVTEAMRWEEDRWELFAGAGPDIPREEMREVPLGTLLGADPTLSPVLGLGVGKGMWRDLGDRVWHPWG